MKTRFLKRPMKQFLRNKDGVAAVEFAMILPVFVVMLFGTLEVGSILFAKTTLQQGIETAGRYAMVNSSATLTQIKDEAIAKSSSLKSLSPTFSVQEDTVDGIPYVVISVSAEYTMLTPFFTGRKIDLSSRMSVPQL